MLFKKHRGTNDLKWRFIGRAGKLIIDLIFAGSRIQVKGRVPIQSILESKRCIFAFWHARILLVSYFHKGWGAAIMVSDSADGEIIAQILQRQGQLTVRGSTGKRGNRAVVKMIREITRNGRSGAVVPDGPQGPRHKVQQGIIFLAQKTGLPIIPITYSAKRRKVLNSWDRFIIPYPATACKLIYGRPIHVPPESEGLALEPYTKILEDELMRITLEADNHFSHQPEN